MRIHNRDILLNKISKSARAKAECCTWMHMVQLAEWRNCDDVKKLFPNAKNIAQNVFKLKVAAAYYVSFRVIFEIETVRINEVDSTVRRK